MKHVAHRVLKCRVFKGHSRLYV